MNLASACRPYYERGTTEALLRELLPQLCNTDERMLRSIKFLDMFLPVTRRQGGREPNYMLWLPPLMSESR